MKKVLILLFLLAVAGCAAVQCRADDERTDVLCQAAAQGAAMAAGDARTVAFATAYVAGSCECTFLPQPGADITCCTDETWAPAAAELAEACQCTFTAHQTIPAEIFDFYACATMPP